MSRKYIVVKDRTPDTDEFLKIRKGEIVKVLKSYSQNDAWPDWMECIHRGVFGYIPLQYLEKLDTDQARLIKDYDAFEFKTKKGEVFILQETLNGWAYGWKEHEPETKGWIPLDHLE
ncbi:MAG TPA: SH3 domain-containing protein [Bacillota bacterium]|nr:SH3 domain-containing protein [Bacillota bacterium]